MTKTIEYSPNGIAVSDHEAEDLARSFFLGIRSSISISTENFIMATRVLIREKAIPHNEVIFLFEGNVVKHDNEGRFEH